MNAALAMLLVLSAGGVWAADPDLTIIRVGDAPIIDARTPGWRNRSDAENINGPCLIRVPTWVEKPLGRWYLYFAHHHGDHIRLAYADRPEGPWRIHSPGVLPMAEAGFNDHIASPDVHIDETNRRIYCFYHGQQLGAKRVHASRAAVSRDGLRFDTPSDIIAPFYLRAWRQGDWWYGIAKSDRGFTTLRTRDPMQPWETGSGMLPQARHGAVWPGPDGVTILFSRIGDAPEALYSAVMPTTAADWRSWAAGTSAPVLRLAPERPWEGADLPITPSASGQAKARLHQLRDPHLARDGDRVLLTYSVAGESGIALAVVNGLP